MSIIKHNFTTTKQDHRDQAVISANEWNDTHSFQLGTNGQTLIADSTQPKDIRWTQGAALTSGFYLAPGTIASPTPKLAEMNFLFLSPTVLIFEANVNATTVGSVTYTVTLLLDDSVSLTESGIPSNTPYFIRKSFSVTTGPHSISLSFNSVGNASFTALVAITKNLSLGV